MVKSLQQSPPSPVGWYFLVFKNYFTVQGRARRSEYWYFHLFNFIVFLLIGSVDFVLMSSGFAHQSWRLSTIYLLFSFIPSITVIVRRLHDVGQSAWWIVLSALMLVNLIIMMMALNRYDLLSEDLFGLTLMLILAFMLPTFILITFMFLDSQPSDNQFGFNPKENRY